jgi:hypothetical protein
MPIRATPTQWTRFASRFASRFAGLCRGTPAVLLAFAAFPAGGVRSGQDPAPSYRYSQLQCAAFSQTVRSDIRIENGGRVRLENSGRTGRITMRAQEAEGGIAVEAWFDWLSMYAGTEAGRRVPDSDGLIGGRFRGHLSPYGEYLESTRPFVPDEVAEVADLGVTMQDLLPPLPRIPLGAGQSWADSTGLRITRLPDSLASTVSIARYRIERRADRTESRPVLDTLNTDVHEVEQEKSVFAWHPRDGVLSWNRRITVETSVPASARLTRPLRTRMEQQIGLVRREEPCH